MINTTWNPNELSGGASLSSDLLTLNMTTHSQGSKSTISRKKGKFYFEVKINSISSNLDIGISDNTYTYTVDSANSPNVVVTRESSVGTVGVAVNLDNNTVDFYKNGVFKESKIITSQLIGIEVFALVRSATSTGSRNVTGNFGATTFSYPVPTGFKAYNDIYSNKFLILSSDEKVIGLEKGEIGENLIPIMTSNTSPSGIASVSSIINSDQPAWKAFDGMNDTYWQSSPNTTAWIAYEFPEKKEVNTYGIVYRNNYLNGAPKYWTFEGSNDGGITWNVLDSQSNITDWSNGIEKLFEFDNSERYKTFRLNMSRSYNDGTYYAIGSLRMLAKSNSKIVELPSLTVENFNNHGMDKSTQIDLNSQMTNKVFIEQSSTTLGSGKVFSKKITRDIIKAQIK